MTTANHNLTYNNYASAGYFGNVIAAARGLLAALFASQPGAAVATEAVVSERSQQATNSYLSRLAADYERHSPALAAELRFMASRG